MVDNGKGLYRFTLDGERVYIFGDEGRMALFLEMLVDLMQRRQKMLLIVEMYSRKHHKWKTIHKEVNTNAKSYHNGNLDPDSACVHDP